MAFIWCYASQLLDKSFELDALYLRPIPVVFLNGGGYLWLMIEVLGMTGVTG